ncbi:hypothetical protein KDA00_02055 [Candidatus Saccharibacteria bacterium]|nr:hypothetical protein [Candidatus Saccharibacteria bacterium]
MIQKVISNFARNKQSERRQSIRRNLLRLEAKIGGQVFGKIPAGHSREFFCLDEHSWVWHEEWIDHNGNRQSMTTRYEIRPSGLIKVQNGHYQPVSYEEAKRFKVATDRYFKRVRSEIYASI